MITQLQWYWCIQKQVNWTYFNKRIFFCTNDHFETPFLLFHMFFINFSKRSAYALDFRVIRLELQHALQVNPLLVLYLTFTYNAPLWPCGQEPGTRQPMNAHYFPIIDVPVLTFPNRLRTYDNTTWWQIATWFTYCSLH